MPLGEVARCFRCNVFASGEELQLNRIYWEYECKDLEACLTRKRNPATERQDRRNRKKSTNYKLKTKLLEVKGPVIPLVPMDGHVIHVSGFTVDTRGRKRGKTKQTGR